MRQITKKTNKVISKSFSNCSFFLKNWSSKFITIDLYSPGIYFLVKCVLQRNLVQLLTILKAMNEIT